ncbi:MAG: GNAT family protein [Phycisphaerales bacterium]
MTSPRERGPRGLAWAVRLGERVFLRPPTPSDEDEFAALRRRSLARLRPWEPLPPPGVSRAPSQLFERLLAQRRSEHCSKLLVCLRSDGAIAGGANLNEIVRGALQGCFAGWWIGDPYEGRGYMREALALLLDHAFFDLALHRVEANIRPENARSLKLAAALGMRREGYSPRYLQIAGAWCDHERWAMLADEWAPKRDESATAVTRPTTSAPRPGTAGSRRRR